MNIFIVCHASYSTVVTSVKFLFIEICLTNSIAIHWTDIIKLIITLLCKLGWMSVEPDQPDKQWHTGELTNLDLLINLHVEVSENRKEFGWKLRTQTLLFKFTQCIQWPLDRLIEVIVYSMASGQNLQCIQRPLDRTYRVFIKLPKHDLQSIQWPLDRLTEYSITSARLTV